MPCETPLVWALPLQRRCFSTFLLLLVLTILSDGVNTKPNLASARPAASSADKDIEAAAEGEVEATRLGRRGVGAGLLSPDPSEEQGVARRGQEVLAAAANAKNASLVAAEAPGLIQNFARGRQRTHLKLQALELRSSRTALVTGVRTRAVWEIIGTMVTVVVFVLAGLGLMFILTGGSVSQLRHDPMHSLENEAFAIYHDPRAQMMTAQHSMHDAYARGRYAASQGYHSGLDAWHSGKMGAPPPGAALPMPGTAAASAASPMHAASPAHAAAAPSMQPTPQTPYTQAVGPGSAASSFHPAQPVAPGQHPSRFGLCC
eukprot:TRINITY_DN1290_c0_g1_i1.p1 TRINITY_DN1290_c0_g1~~TRINITY_DN1290_c0_g1_i1.p1  ORF type:complete len:317 (+),score=43.77 TRINITY_DN1290_c0_g1_i1:159-1109(+)